MKNLIFDPKTEAGNPNALITKASEFVIGGSLDGDYLEFGVFEGRSMAMAYHAFARAYENVINRYGFLMSDEVKGWVRDRWAAMRFRGFDSFEGLPAITSGDAGGPFKQGDYACSLERVEKNLAKAGVDLNRVQLVKGWYQDSLNAAAYENLGQRKAAVIHVDCDLYESTKTVLDFCTPLITDGTVVIFDDWFQFRGHPQRGEQRAFREWSEANNQFIATEFHKEGVWRNSFILNLKEGTP